MAKEKEEGKSRREILLELQFLDSQIKQAEQQMSQAEEQIFEVNILIDSLCELKTAKRGQEILVPVANGIFIKAKIEDKDLLKVNVGGGVVVEKTIDGTIEMLRAQVKNIEKYKDETFAQLSGLVAQASSLQSEIVGED